MAMNNGILRLFGTNIVITTADEPSRNCLQPFIPKIFSSGGAGILRNFTIDDGVDASSSKFSTVDDDDDDGVDTTLSLSASVSSSYSDPPLVNCPMPLKVCFPPGFIPKSDFCYEGYDSSSVEITAPDQVHTTLSSNHAGDDQKGGSKSGKRKRGGVGAEKKRRYVKRKRDNGADDENSHPIPSLEDIPGLVETIESRNGTRPVFLYRKKLKESDVNGHHNRLFVTRRERFMEFLTEEEVRALNHSKEGLEIFAVDPQGKLYKLAMKIWQSLKMMVINSDWNKLVVGNNAEKGDWIEIWGYRESDKLRFAVNFRKSEV